MGAAMSEYRKKAEECLRAVEKMRDPAERIEMLGIARNYMVLAAHAGKSADRPDKNLEMQKHYLVATKRPHQSWGRVHTLEETLMKGFTSPLIAGLLLTAIVCGVARSRSGLRTRRCG